MVEVDLVEVEVDLVEVEVPIVVEVDLVEVEAPIVVEVDLVEVEAPVPAQKQPVTWFQTDAKLYRKDFPANKIRIVQMRLMEIIVKNLFV